MSGENPLLENRVMIRKTVGDGNVRSSPAGEEKVRTGVTPRRG